MDEMNKNFINGYRKTYRDDKVVFRFSFSVDNCNLYSVDFPTVQPVWWTFNPIFHAIPRICNDRLRDFVLVEDRELNLEWRFVKFLVPDHIA